MNKYCKEFLESVAQSKDYWLNLDNDIVEKSCKFVDETPLEYRMNGLIFSIMVLLDGNSSLNNFKTYNIKYGSTSINKDIRLHDNVFEYLKNRE